MTANTIEKKQANVPGLKEALMIIERRINTWQETMNCARLAHERLVAASKIRELEVLQLIITNEIKAGEVK